VKFELDDDHYEFASVVDQTLRRAGAPAVARSCSEGSDDGASELLVQLDAVGLPGLTVPEEHGGSGLRATDCVLVLEALGRHLGPDPLALVIGAVAPAVVRHAPATVAADILAPLAAGTLRMSAQDGWDGWAPWAAHADVVCVVDGDEVCVVRPGPDDVEPLAGSDGSRRIGRVRRGVEPLVVLGAAAAGELRLRAAVTTATVLSGVSDAMLRTAAAYASQRRQFGTPVGAFQGVKHLLADAFAGVEASRRVAWWAMLCVDEGSGEAESAAAMAKAMVGDASRDASHASLQAHGGIGYTWDCDLHLWMKRAQALEGAWGSTAVQWGRLRRLLAAAPAA
jgi:alkylation response protein AidB-like acyl-CoA dehydrogenase